MVRAWINHGEETVWASNWLEVVVADIESPTGRRGGYDIVRARYAGAAALVENDMGEVLLIYRHRLAPDAWGWELPAGGVAAGEDPVTAAAREVVEETGWELANGKLVWSVWRCPERSDHVGHLVRGQAGRQLGPHDPDEVAQLGWFDRRGVWELLRSGSVGDVFTVAALFWWVWSTGGWVGAQSHPPARGPLAGARQP